MEKNKLYVLIDKSLEPVYGCVQGGHVVAQWLLDHPAQTWNNQYLIYLSADIQKWKNKLDLFDIEYSEFKEPDLGDRITALAVHGHDRIFKNLDVITEE